MYVIDSDRLKQLLAQVKVARPDDAAQLEAIFSAPDGVTVARLIRAYHADADRSDRTPRELLYFHLGALGGILEQLLQLLEHPGQVH